MAGQDSGLVRVTMLDRRAGLPWALVFDCVLKTKAAVGAQVPVTRAGRVVWPRTANGAELASRVRNEPLPQSDRGLERA